MNDRPHKVLVTGLPHFARRVGGLVANGAWRVSIQTPEVFGGANRRRFEHGRLLASLPFYDLVYQIGGPTIDRRVTGMFSGLRRPVILHWVGSDVCSAIARPLVQRQLSEKAIVHWADSPWLQNELASIGIKSAIMPCSAAAATHATSLPAGPLTVLLYLPAERWDFYSGPQMARIASELPTINFLIVGDDGSGRSQVSNVRYLGWVPDMDRVYPQCHVLVRMPLHDGLSAMVIEALSHGRHVMWNYPMTGVLQGSTAEQVIAQLVELERDHVSQSLSLNKVGKAFVESNFSEAKVAKEIRGGFETALAALHERKVSKLGSGLETL